MRPVALPTPIKLRFSTIDRFNEIRTFKSMEGAKAYAKKRLGTSYDFGSTYAVDMWGTGKLEIISGNTTFAELMS